MDSTASESSEAGEDLEDIKGGYKKTTTFLVFITSVSHEYHLSSADRAQSTGLKLAFFLVMLTEIAVYATFAIVMLYVFCDGLRPLRRDVRPLYRVAFSEVRRPLCSSAVMLQRIHAKL